MRWSLALTVVAWIALSAVRGASGVPGEQPRDCPDIPGLLAFYQFDGDLEDSGPNGLDAVSTDTLSFVTDHDGAARSAAFVDGHVDTLWVSDPGVLDLTGAVTLAGWIRPDLHDRSYCCVIDKGYVTAYSLGVRGAIVPATRPVTMVIGDHPFTSPDVVPLGQGTWTHVACSFNEATNVAQFYVNGAVAAADTFPADIGRSNQKLRIGRSYWGDEYRGAIDQLAIFNRELTAKEVLALYEFD